MAALRLTQNSFHLSVLMVLDGYLHKDVCVKLIQKARVCCFLPCSWSLVYSGGLPTMCHMLVHQAPPFKTFRKAPQPTLARAEARSLLVERAWVTHKVQRVDSYPAPMQRVANPAAGDMLAPHVHIRPNETTHLLTTSPRTYVHIQPLNTHTTIMRS